MVEKFIYIEIIDFTIFSIIQKLIFKWNIEIPGENIESMTSLEPPGQFQTPQKHENLSNHDNSFFFVEGRDA